MQRLGLGCRIHSTASRVTGLSKVLSEAGVCKNLMASWTCGLSSVHGDGGGGDNEKEGHHKAALY